MATLLPSLSSDEDEPTKAQLHKEEQDNDSGDEVNEDFEFGGILGEDGGLQQWNASSVSWSYQSALDLLERNDQARGGTRVPRMDVASLVKAKRRALLKGDWNDNEEDLEEEEKQSEEDDESKENSSKSGEEASTSSDSSSDSEDDEDDQVDDETAAKDHMEADVLTTRTGDDNLEKESSKESSDSDSDAQDGSEREEARKAAAFFDDDARQTERDEITLFSQLTLSRPLLRGVAAMGFVRPTLIQAAVIPVALAGRDVCASAVTGSGKTAAFVLPILERLLNYQRGGGTKGLILTPTRELAAQCLGMMTTLAQYTKIRAALIVGGAKNVNAQAAELRTRPDVVVATPGRLLDHVMNSSGVTLDDVQFLILDEADRLLDLGFQEEVHELITACPIERQTMLFSATMTTKVDELVKLSLKRPVRLKISDKTRSSSGTDVEVAPRLEQEFVRVRTGNEGVNREGMLLGLLTRTFTKRTIVFFDTKATAHRLMILCGLCGIQCAELHGNLTQVQRLTALEQFRRGEVDILLATDLAARGLDIDRVETVINFEMPNQVETYVHRIGRTARAGRGGRSCTLIGEGRRHLMKEVIKDAEEKSKRANGSNGNKSTQSSKTGVIRSRTIPPAVVAHFVAKINSLEPHIEEVFQAEAVARMDRLADMEAARAQNIIEHSNEIMARPQREWFASNQQKQMTKAAVQEKQRMIAEKVGTGVHRMTRKKRRAKEAREELTRYREEMRQEQEESGRPPKKVSSELTIKAKARARKRQDETNTKERMNESVQDEDNIKKRKKKKQKEKSSVFASDSLGDSSLFADEKVSLSKKPRQEAKSSYQFTEYDPSKLPLKGKKKSVKSFKSKSKYKRRK